MQETHHLLRTIYEIVQHDPHPLHYQCSTREIILRHKGGWQQEHLETLSSMGLITVKKLERVVVCITAEGFEQAKALPVSY